MTITAQLRQQVPERAQYAGEFCEVTETDTGAELTIDHFHPQTLDGSDAVDNLLYCCVRCNQYKSDYWPIEPDDTPLWNPRQEPRTQHLLELSDGRIHPLTHIGGFTIHRLRLNRPPLVDHRLHKRQHAATT